VFQVEEIVDFSRHENLADRLARRFGAQAVQSVTAALKAAAAAVTLR
jgi:hypothetical protein